MKYDCDLIEAIYILQQKDSSLAERMWNRLVVDSVENTTNSMNIRPGLTVTGEIIDYIKENHNSYNKVTAIKAMREQTGWGLKDSKDAIDMMIAKGILH